MQKRILKTCKNGHQFYKSSSCPICPICEKQKKTTAGFLSDISAPARRALQNNGINSLAQLAKYSENEILEFHGMGPSSIPILRDALKEKGLSFKA